MVVSVGGAAAPITKALEVASPRFVLFVVSSDSRPQVEDEVLPSLVGNLPQWECLTVTDHEDIGRCYGEIRRGLVGWMERRELKDSEVAVDITGATKPMSAALALSAVERFSSFKYVGGDIRDKRNLGVVVDGAERILTCQNPWNTFAVRDLERAASLLRECHADLAAAVLGEAAKRCDEAIAARLDVLSRLVQSYGFADRFDFKGAINAYRRGRSSLSLVVGQSLRVKTECDFKRWEVLREQTKDNSQTPGRETILELIANADRRAGQFRWDDAVGRLYRVIELYAQGLAKRAFESELGKVPRASLPAEHRAWMQREYGTPRDGMYKLGIQPLFRILERCGGTQLRSAGSYNRLKKHLQRRNSSLFAHGSIPVKERAFRGFRAAVLAELKIGEDEIPGWPDIASALEQVL